MQIFKSAIVLSAVFLSAPVGAEPVAAPAAVLAPPPANASLPPPAPTERPSLRGSVVYVYSFLDVRQWQFGRKTLKLVNSDLIDDLKASGVQAKALSFASSPIASSFKFPRFYGPPETRVPVEKVMSANAGDERQARSKYRLIVFPKDFSASGTGGSDQHWVIEWTLIDVATSKRVWSGSTQGDRFLWYYDYGAKECAKGIVEAFMAEFRKSGLL